MIQQAEFGGRSCLGEEVDVEFCNQDECPGIKQNSHIVTAWLGMDNITHTFANCDIANITLDMPSQNIELDLPSQNTSLDT